MCIKDLFEEPTYLEGLVLITRSPSIHPGDVQQVTAIGRPPPGSPFEHEELPNCIVFASKGDYTPFLHGSNLILDWLCTGTHSLPQSLGGGDLDGDLYNVIELSKAPEFKPESIETPGSYPPPVLKLLPEGQACTISDVAVRSSYYQPFTVSDGFMCRILSSILLQTTTSDSSPPKTSSLPTNPLSCRAIRGV